VSSEPLKRIAAQYNEVVAKIQRTEERLRDLNAEKERLHNEAVEALPEDAVICLNPEDGTIDRVSRLA
jgi:hypothetical protein